jgi:hypothetical protein
MCAPGRGSGSAISPASWAPLQVDGYVAYKQLTKSERAEGPLVLASYWRRFRACSATERQRADRDEGPAGHSDPLKIRGQSADQRRAVRRACTKLRIIWKVVWVILRR